MYHARPSIHPRCNTRAAKPIHSAKPRRDYHTLKQMQSAYSGTIQGDTLSPCLFIFFPSSHCRGGCSRGAEATDMECLQGDIDNKGHTLRALAYANDVAGITCYAGRCESTGQEDRIFLFMVRYETGTKVHVPSLACCIIMQSSEHGMSSSF